MLIYTHKNLDGTTECFSLDAVFADEGRACGHLTVRIAHGEPNGVGVSMPLSPSKAMRFVETAEGSKRDFKATAPLGGDDFTHFVSERNEGMPGLKISLYVRATGKPKRESHTFILSPAECLTVAAAIRSAMSRVCFGR